jgi:hypothetical protein
MNLIFTLTRVSMTPYIPWLSVRLSMTELWCDCWIENPDGAYACAHPGNCRGRPVASAAVTEMSAFRIMDAETVNPDYRAILKRYVSEVFTHDHVVALNAVADARDEDKRILVEIGLELGQEENDEWMCRVFTSAGEP